jgi:pSer/pThr/pTyr-binding forkhead associated (FHA) protein
MLPTMVRRPHFRADGEPEERFVRIERPVTRIGHAFIIDTAVGVVLLDDDSPDGTFVNGERVRRTILEPGDRIAVGGRTLTFLDE